MISRRRLQFGLACLVIVTCLLAMGPRLTSATPPQPVPQAEFHAVSATPETPSPGCPIAGDLVGDANPAIVAAALCGP
jgi:hypothetical protein